MQPSALCVLLRLEVRAILDTVRALRTRLAGAAEISGSEQHTAGIIAAFLAEHGIEVETGIGGHGVLARLGEGPAVLLRADLDALPGPDGARHRCGHDGHMAMLAGALTHWRPGDPAIMALFQPSEEDGTGMQRCLDDPRLADAEITAAYAIHNIPGMPLGQVLVTPGALASTGVRIRLTGRPAHAASPHEGHSPYAAMRTLADAVVDLPAISGEAGALATLIHARLGEEAYGTSPGEAVVAATLRGSDAAVAAMKAAWIALIPGDVAHVVDEVDPFPETRSTPEGIAAVRAAAASAGLETQDLESPFSWSEDFGHACAKFGGALIGLGSGVDQPPLHDIHYEFPDALLEHGVHFWTALGGMS